MRLKSELEKVCTKKVYKTKKKEVVSLVGFKPTPYTAVVSRGQTAFFRILGGEKRVWCNSNSCLLLSRPHIPGMLIE